MNASRPPTPARVFESAEAIGDYVAEKVLGLIEGSRRLGNPFLLGCPTGRTPRPIYAAMASRLARSKQDISHLLLVMMDEYLVQTRGAFEYAAANMPWSCHHFAEVEIVHKLNRDLPAGRGVRRHRVWFPDPEQPPTYDEKIVAAGGIDFFILASGASDGHVAFNPPGSTRDSRTRIIELSDSTRLDNLQTFPAFGSLSNVPTHGISVGIATIAAAKQSVMVLIGSSKAKSLARINASREYDASWPATIIHECAAAEILSDTDAAKHTQGKP
jgi:glucosamine-6-phosphate deaminase